MSLFERSLAKLTLTAYSDREMSHQLGSIAAMYNPAALQLSFRAEYKSDEFLNSNTQSSTYQRTLPGDFDIELLFDASMPGNNTPVEEQISSLRNLCYAVNSEQEEPSFLQVKWGQMRWENRGYFSGRMSALSVRYTLFDRDGTPLRATANLSLIADASLTLQASSQQLKKPSTLRLPAATTVALLAATALAGGMTYLDLAASNDMDNLHDVEPGDTLLTGNR
jgi:hypothetical protein